MRRSPPEAPMRADLSKLPESFLRNALIGTVMRLEMASPEEAKVLIAKRDALAAEVARRRAQMS